MSTNTKTMGRDEAVKVLRGYSQQHGNPEDFDLAIAALQAQGEPVAWVIPEEINNLAWHDGHTTPGIKPYSTDERTLPLYTHPAPQQPAALRIVEPVLNRATPGTREAEMAVLETDENGVPTIWCDPEIADLVRALNVGGVRTVASCSGHGERLGSIALADGRALVICSSPDEAIAVIRSHEGPQPAAGAAMEFDGTDREVLREFIRICREHKPVGPWPGERVCKAIERAMDNEKPFRFIAEADMAPERAPSMKDADRMLSGPRRAAPPPAAVDGYTTGHCERNKQPGGCDLNNLSCGWPACDRRPATQHKESDS